MSTRPHLAIGGVDQGLQLLLARDVAGRGQDLEALLLELGPHLLAGILPCGCETTTLAPARASSSAIDLPMPRVEPVTSATLPLKSNSGGFHYAKSDMTKLTGKACRQNIETRNILQSRSTQN